MVVTKQNLIDMGIKEDRIVVFDIPTCVVNKNIMVCKAHKYRNLDDLKNEAFIKDMIDGAGFIFMYYDDNCIYKNCNEPREGYILRLFEKI
jgi:hypothetical protein